MPKFLEALGTAYLHKSEMENDAYRDPGDRCIFPPRASFKYTDAADSQKAIQYFLKYLEQKPDDLEVKWLLNMAYLTVGGYPASVPPKYLIPVAAFSSKEEVGRFVDVAPLLGYGPREYQKVEGGVEPLRDTARARILQARLSPLPEFTKTSTSRSPPPALSS